MKSARVILSNECFIGELRPAHLSPDGETRSLVVVTQEINGWAMFVHSEERGTELREFDLASRDRLIQKAARMTDEARRERDAAEEREFNRKPARKKASS